MDNWRMVLANLEQMKRKEFEKKRIERTEWYKKVKEWTKVRKLW